MNKKHLEYEVGIKVPINCTNCGGKEGITIPMNLEDDIFIRCIDCEQNLYSYVLSRNKFNPFTYWITKDKKRIKLTDMTENHLKACINMCKNNPNWRKLSLPALEHELHKRLTSTDIGKLIYE